MSFVREERSAHHTRYASRQLRVVLNPATGMMSDKGSQSAQTLAPLGGTMKSHHTRILAATAIAAALVFGGATTASAAVKTGSVTSTDEGSYGYAFATNEGNGSLTIKDLKCDSRGAVVYYRVNGGSWKSEGVGTGCGEQRVVSIPRVNTGSSFQMYACTNFGSTNYSCSATKTLSF